MISENNRRLCGLEQRSQALLALKVAQLRNVLALVDEQVESVKSEIGLAALQARLEKLEARLAALVERDRFAIDQAAAGKR